MNVCKQCRLIQSWITLDCMQNGSANFCHPDSLGRAGSPHPGPQVWGPVDEPLAGGGPVPQAPLAAGNGRFPVSHAGHHHFRHHRCPQDGEPCYLLQASHSQPSCSLLLHVPGRVLASSCELLSIELLLADEGRTLCSCSTIESVGHCSIRHISLARIMSTNCCKPHRNRCVQKQGKGEAGTPSGATLRPSRAGTPKGTPRGTPKGTPRGTPVGTPAASRRPSHTGSSPWARFSDGNEADKASSKPAKSPGGKWGRVLPALRTGGSHSRAQPDSPAWPSIDEPGMSCRQDLCMHLHVESMVYCMDLQYVSLQPLNMHQLKSCGL